MTSGKKVVLVVVGAAVVLVGLILAATLLGAFLPREHSVSRSVQISQPPEAVWQVITDYPGEPAWRPGLKSVERQPDRMGRETWKLTDEYGDVGYMEVVEAAPPRRLVQEFTDARGKPTGPAAWEYRLTPSDGGTRVTITQHGNYPNPFLRFVMRFMIGYEKFTEEYLRALAQKFGDPPTIEEGR
jgi:uncharacterized protein YndB with AHSA1/START domain